MNLKDIIAVIKIPVDQLKATKATNKRIKYSDVKIICNSIATKTTIIVYYMAGIICDLKKKILFLEPKSDLILLV
jgi:hypothetical protein